jgi:hypothetical protein
MSVCIFMTALVVCLPIHHRFVLLVERSPFGDFHRLLFYVMTAVLLFVPVDPPKRGMKVTDNLYVKENKLRRIAHS